MLTSAGIVNQYVTLHGYKLFYSFYKSSFILSYNQFASSLVLLAMFSGMKSLPLSSSLGSSWSIISISTKLTEFLDPFFSFDFSYFCSKFLKTIDLIFFSIFRLASFSLFSSSIALKDVFFMFSPSDYLSLYDKPLTSSNRIFLFIKEHGDWAIENSRSLLAKRSPFVIYLFIFSWLHCMESNSESKCICLCSLTLSIVGFCVIHKA